MLCFTNGIMLRHLSKHDKRTYIRMIAVSHNFTLSHLSLTAITYPFSHCKELDIKKRYNQWISRKIRQCRNVLTCRNAFQYVPPQLWQWQGHQRMGPSATDPRP
ncbi:hypothetical protein AVEN_65351-1 [Araneus ventricosus]|uniref:Uncharacterized protein n=1 Tax=Araneus ventricosus TaxID=182803 RepID=A0A4Y2H8F5_ARAVE|nr:hypothetical protein AVEN_65351-1 [Araneus ventricosus]